MILDDGGDVTLLVHKGVQFEAAGVIDGEMRAAVGRDAAVEHLEDGLLGPELGGEELVEFLRAAHLHGLEGHDGPRGDGEEHQEDDDDLRLDGAGGSNTSRGRIRGGQYAAGCLAKCSRHSSLNVVLESF